MSFKHPIIGNANEHKSAILNFIKTVDTEWEIGANFAMLQLVLVARKHALIKLCRNETYKGSDNVKTKINRHPTEDILLKAGADPRVMRKKIFNDLIRFKHRHLTRRQMILTQSILSSGMGAQGMNPFSYPHSLSLYDYCTGLAKFGVF